MPGERRGMPDGVVDVQPNESVVGAEVRESPALAMISSMFRKIALGIGLVVLAAVAAYQVLGLRVSVDGSGMIPRFLSSEPDYDALEADRARQRALLLSADLPQAPPATIESGAAEGVTDALSSLVGALVVETPSESSPPEASAVLPKAGYWPDFRGSRRDGRYDAGPVLTGWPEDGLQQLWKQPIGLGFASFVVADGRAFTIEQRRDQESCQPTRSSRAESSGRFHGLASSSRRWAATGRGRRRPITRGGCTRWGRLASCAVSTLLRGTWSGGATSSPTQTRRI